jgi:hypothetical protein
MSYSEGYLNKLRERVSIRQFINYDLPVNRNSRSTFQCPFCLNPSNRLVIKDLFKRFVCIDCGKNGDVFLFVKLLFKYDDSPEGFSGTVETVANVSAQLYLNQIPHTVSEMARLGG